MLKGEFECHRAKNENEDKGKVPTYYVGAEEEQGTSQIDGFFANNLAQEGIRHKAKTWPRTTLEGGHVPVSIEVDMTGVKGCACRLHAVSHSCKTQCEMPGRS